MTALALLGAAGVGLTWGWMLGWLASGGRRFRNGLAAIAATLLLLGAATYHAGPGGAAAAGVGVVFTLLLHLGQQRRWSVHRH